MTNVARFEKACSRKWYRDPPKWKVREEIGNEMHGMGHRGSVSEFWKKETIDLFGIKTQPSFPFPPLSGFNSTQHNHHILFPSGLGFAYSQVPLSTAPTSLFSHFFLTSFKLNQQRGLWLLLPIILGSICFSDFSPLYFNGIVLTFWLYFIL